MRGYLNTYLEGDIEGHFGVQRLSDFFRFLELLAIRVGQLLNSSELARDAGISDVTGRKWPSLLAPAIQSKAQISKCCLLGVHGTFCQPCRLRFVAFAGQELGQFDIGEKGQTSL